MDKAVAIKYDAGAPAPFIAAKGTRELARRILALAAEYNVEIVQMPELADMLLELEVGSYIPEDLYQVVAELLAYVYRVQAGR